MKGFFECPTLGVYDHIIPKAVPGSQCNSVIFFSVLPKMLRAALRKNDHTIKFITRATRHGKASEQVRHWLGFSVPEEFD